METAKAMLMKIDDDRVVVLDGVKYLVMYETPPKTTVEPSPKPTPQRIQPKSRKKQKPRVPRAKVEPAILKVLEKNPNSKSIQIFEAVKREYGVHPSETGFKSILHKMKNDGLVEVTGVKNGAKWALKKQETPVNPLSQIKGPSEQEHVAMNPNNVMS